MMKWMKPNRLFGIVCATTAWLLLPTVALAQQYEKVSEALGEKVPARPFILAAYGFIWAAVMVYVLFVARGLGRVRNDLEAFRRKIESESKNTAGR
jgi:hypothetical protein